MLELATRLYIPWPGWKRGWGWSACWQYQWGCSRASPTSTGWPTFPSGRGGWSLVPVPPYFLSRPWSRSRHFSGPGLGPGPGQIYGPVTQWLTVPGGGADGGGAEWWDGGVGALRFRVPVLGHMLRHVPVRHVSFSEQRAPFRSALRLGHRNSVHPHKACDPQERVFNRL